MSLHEQVLDLDRAFCHVMVIPGKAPVIVATQMRKAQDHESLDGDDGDREHQLAAPLSAKLD